MQVGQSEGLDSAGANLTLSPWARWLMAAGVTLLLAATVAGSLYYARGEVIDDAYISFRYAQNLVAGHGLVFNPGDRVEGYSNLLWVLLLAGAAALGADLVVASKVLGAACALATVAALWRFAPEDRGTLRWGALIAPALLVANPSVALWSVHGLETALFTLLITLGLREDVAAHNRGEVPRYSSLWYALAAWTRPEGPYFFVISALFGVASAPRRWLSRRGVRWAAVFVLLEGGHLAWRVVYYGDFFPNPYYLKVAWTAASFGRGLAYVGGFFATPGATLFLAAIPALLAARRARWLLFLSIATVGYVGCVAVEGGDAFLAYRFLVPVLGAVYVLVQEGVRRAARSRSSWTRIAVALVLIATAGLHGLHVKREVDAEVFLENEFIEGLRAVGLALRERFPPGTTIALNPAGAVPYYSGFRTYDMLGVTDRHIARTSPRGLGTGQSGHEKGDGTYILGLRPDLILAGNVAVIKELPPPGFQARPLPMHRSEEEIFAHPDLPRLYEVAELRLPDGRWLVFLRRRF